ncbi:hypothetical protein BJV74DRAFT_452600 [Russula compacta]|nr:hypothetical protein BJV74DRAFT_452600 [Russula compacta]
MRRPARLLCVQRDIHRWEIVNNLHAKKKHRNVQKISPRVRKYMKSVHQLGWDDQRSESVSPR